MIQITSRHIEVATPPPKHREKVDLRTKTALVVSAQATWPLGNQVLFERMDRIGYCEHSFKTIGPMLLLANYASAA